MKEGAESGEEREQEVERVGIAKRGDALSLASARLPSSRTSSDWHVSW
jgi:hypothetical protein